MPKKKIRLDDLGGLVFSTDPDLVPTSEEEVESIPIEDQVLRVYLDKKNRKGKIVTIVEGLEGSNEEFSTLAKMLKTLCGTGGSVKDELIIIQGNFKDKVTEKLTRDGYHVEK